MLRNLEQERAKYAWDCIQKAKKEDGDLEKKYRSYVKRAISLILVNGLGNTLAFYRSKFEASLREGREKELGAEKKAYKLLYDHLDKWFKKQFRENKDLLEWIIDERTSSIKVFHVTKELIALLNWMGRFAEAELKE